MFLGVFVQADLVVAGDEPGEPDAQEPDEQTAVVELVEDLAGCLQQNVIGVGEVDGFLAGYGIEVRIANFHGEAAGELILAAQLETNGFGETGEFGVQEPQVDGIAPE